MFSTLPAYERKNMSRRLMRHVVCALATLFLSLPLLAAEPPLDIASRRELFVDRHLIAHLDSVRRFVMKDADLFALRFAEIRSK